jgi:hypothetical protein
MRDPQCCQANAPVDGAAAIPVGEIIAGFGPLIGIKTRRGKPTYMASTNTLERF